MAREVYYGAREVYYEARRFTKMALARAGAAYLFFKLILRLIH